jgi:hypothetical protein
LTLKPGIGPLLTSATIRTTGPAADVMMDRTETVAKGRLRQAPVGETWDDHASMAPEQIRDQLAAALQAYGGPSVAPHFKIEEIEESGDRSRFDIGYDIREHFTTSTRARISAMSRREGW